MTDPLLRKLFALANWKMAMTVAESLAFVRQFRLGVGDLIRAVDTVLCPPYTALHPMAQALEGTPIALGAQNLCAAPGPAHTGEISAQLLADVGCEWVMLNHWEIRRRTGESDAEVNHKIRAAFQVGLRPVLLIGEAASEQGRAEEALEARLPTLLAGCGPDRVSQMAILYEPEWTIGVQEPAPPDRVAAGCSFIRRWLAQEYGGSGRGDTHHLRRQRGARVRPGPAGMS